MIGLHRAIKLLLFTTASSVAAYSIAYLLRFDFDPQGEVPQYTIWIGLSCLIASRLLCYIFFRATNLTWRYFSLTEFLPLIKAHLASTALFLAAVLMLRLPDFPRSIAAIEFMLSLILNAGAALSIRLAFERGLYPLQQAESDLDRKPTIILGGGTSGHLLVKSLLTQKRAGFEPVGVLDDSSRLASNRVHGVPILGPLSHLADILERDASIASVILAIPSLSLARIKTIEELCKSRGVELQRLRSFEDIAVQQLSRSIESLSAESILKREFGVEYSEDVLSAYKGKSVLVTGGAGSIGSEVVRQLALMEASQIIIVDNSEFHLFYLKRELLEKFPDASFTFVLLDICDKTLLEIVMQTYAPQVVIHAAAYKHVPLSEENPYSVFRVNAVGTHTVLRLAIAYNAEKFILLSTDKAVQPANVMGRTKRLAELITQEEVRCATGKTEAAIVRFGNVINSRGSVIPLFTEQITAGGPLTVTHPDVERYFMSIQEAVRLMLAAGTLGSKAEIFALDMGERIKILEVAREMLKLAGREDIDIIFTGLRPGEKLIEDVSSASEELEPTSLDKVQKIVATGHPADSYVEKVEKLYSDHFEGNPSAFKEKLSKLV